MNDRPALLSVTGIVVAALLLAGVLAWTLAAGPVLFSPGPLNAQAKARPLGGVSTHAQLAGDCGACHPAPWSSQTAADKCVACHADIGSQIAAKTGLHGGLVGKLSSPTCRGCHPEHNGPAGKLTVIDESTFPHDLTGYSLNGHQRTSKGVGFVCSDCHPTSLSQFDVATCAACHTAINASFMSTHETTFGKDCLPCHPGNGLKFDHRIFPMDHGSNEQKATCKTCHPTNTSTYTCFGCHRHTPTNLVAGHEGRTLADLQNCIRCHPQGRQGDN